MKKKGRLYLPQPLLPYKNLFDQQELTTNERRMAMKALVNIASRVGVECFAAEARVDKAFLQDTNEMTFSNEDNEDMEVGYSNYRRPLYLAASINQIPIKRALVNTGTSMNLIPLSMLLAIGTPESKIQGCRMEVTGFRGRGEYTVGHIHLWLKVGPIAS